MNEYAELSSDLADAAVDYSPEGRGRTVVVTSLASDSHTWNLVFLQLFLEELGYDVVNLGPCVPDELLVEECRARRPDLVVVSSVNGHGYQEGLRVIRELRAHGELVDLPMAIGGKLGVGGAQDTRYAEELMVAGFDLVIEEGAGTSAFRHFIESLPQRALP
ncbi:methylaspartate mutase sigma subunit [Streptosporangium album]|uniref:Methylaspartate mutase sigma subunit n=1 Tax=Streptosporangium album TaxID=47479 RepID=A0A7W7S544_9ACTN|nr:cobalamin-dependent protein [Streptosporangium album]MBB4944049.1 methylaspartate mutase sigma subunit [Streptosporangium album]